MMAPNPHWIDLPAERYSYSDSGSRFGYLIFIGILFIWHLPCGLLWRERAWFPFASFAIYILAFLASKGWFRRANEQLEIRSHFLTLYRSSDVVEHEDMREIQSLEVVTRRNGRVNYHMATFSTGHRIEIYPNLVRHDELIAKLRSYLPLSPNSP